VLLAPAFAAAGSEFDEGLLMAFPARVLDGDLPYRDFETFYGPAEPFLVGGAFKLFGATLATERALGLAFRLLIVLLLYVLLLRWGRIAALGGGVAAACVVAADGLNLDNDLAAQGLVLLAIVLAGRGAGLPPVQAAAGVALGCAALFRPEAAVVGLAATAPFLVAVRRRDLAAFAGGAIVALTPYLPLMLAAGYGRLSRNVHDLVATGHDRRLPIEFVSDGGQLLAGLIVSLAVLAVAFAMSARRRGPNVRVLAALVLLSVGNLPYALWRNDGKHAAYAALVPLAALPAAASVLVRRRPQVAVVATALVLALFATSGFVRGGISRNAKLLIGRARGHVVSYHGRDFRVEDPVAARELQAAVRFAARVAPQHGSLFVGPTDLRRTTRNDVFVYYLLPDLRPASFALELEPWAARAGSRLPRELARADVLILAARWNRPQEGDGTVRPGSSAAATVVRRGFCRRAAYGGYEVLVRCRSRAG
jgi:hypothetical protein